MAVRWPFFAGGALVAATALLCYGAPPAPVLAGTGLAAAWNWFRGR